MYVYGVSSFTEDRAPGYRGKGRGKAADATNPPVAPPAEAEDRRHPSRPSVSTVEADIFARPTTEQADADLLIAVREAAAECEALLREKLKVMEAFVVTATALADARLRYESLRSAAFRGRTVPHFDDDGFPSGSHREDILDPGPVLTMEHLVATDYSVKAIRDSFSRACNFRG